MLKNWKVCISWLEKIKVDLICGFFGTLAMSFAMAASKNGGDMKAEVFEKLKSDPTAIAKYNGHYLDPFIIIQHPRWNQFGLMLIGIGFILPYFFRASFKIQMLMIFIAIPLYFYLIFGFA